MESGLLWKSVLGEIELNVNPSVYATWFKKTRLLSHDEQELIVEVPNIFTQKQLETQFQSLIRKALLKNNVNDCALVYKIVSATKTKSTKTEALNQEANAGYQLSSDWQKSGLGLNEKYSFESFIPGPGNELAYAACQAVVNDLGCKYNPLFVYGGVGIGKTHLIQAVGNKILKNNHQFKVVYLTTEQFVQEFTNAIRYKQMAHFTQRYRNIDVLIIDDIQFIANKEKTQEEFFHTFNVLHEAGKQIIISSDKPPTAIPTLQERLQSRFQMGMTIDMQVPDLETRCAILKMKADKMHLKIEPECVEFLAANISTNIRVLEGALNQLNVFCEAHRVSLATTQLAQKIFEKHFKKGRLTKTTSKQIIEKTARYFQINIEDVLGPKRDKEIVLARQIAMYLMRHELHFSFPKIAQTFNKKDHTTAMHSVAKIEKSMVYNEDIKQSLREIRGGLKV